jgi:hypothetical protein
MGHTRNLDNLCLPWYGHSASHEWHHGTSVPKSSVHPPTKPSLPSTTMRVRRPTLSRPTRCGNLLPALSCMSQSIARLLFRCASRVPKSNPVSQADRRTHLDMSGNAGSTSQDEFTAPRLVARPLFVGHDVEGDPKRRPQLTDVFISVAHSPRPLRQSSPVRRVSGRVIHARAGAPPVAYRRNLPTSRPSSHPSLTTLCQEGYSQSITP